MRPVGLAAVSRARCARAVPAKLVLASASTILSSSSTTTATTVSSICRFSRQSYSTLSTPYLAPSQRNASGARIPAPDVTPAEASQPQACASTTTTPIRSSRRERTLAYLRSRRSSAPVPDSPLRQPLRRLPQPSAARRFHSSRRHRHDKDGVPRRPRSSADVQDANAALLNEALLEQDSLDDHGAFAPQGGAREHRGQARPPLDDLEAFPIRNGRYSKEKVREWVAVRKQRHMMRRKLLEISREKNASNAPIHVIGSDPRATYIAHHLSHKPGSNPVCLILPTKGTQERWETEGSRITLVRGGKVEYSNEIYTEFLNISSELMAGIRETDAVDPRVHTRIYHLVVTLPCRNTVRALSRLAHRIGPWTTVCLIHNGMGVAELLNRTVFRGKNRAPSYVIGHMSHDLGYDVDKFFTVRELKPGLLRLASYTPYGTHFDHQSPEKQAVDPTPRWGEHEHRLQRRLWKPDQRAIAGGPSDWRHRRPYRRLGTARVAETTSPRSVASSGARDEKPGEDASDVRGSIGLGENDDDHAGDPRVQQEDDTAGTADRDFPANVSMVQRTASDSSSTAEEASVGESHKPVVVYEPGQTRRPTRPTMRTMRAYELGRRRRWMLSQDVYAINAPKILADNKPRYLIIYMLATTPKLFAGRYSLYSVYRRKLPEMIYTASFEPVATVMQLPISRATWANPVVRTLILGIIEELILAATWIPELLKSYKLRHDIRTGMLRRRVLNEFFARTSSEVHNLLMGYEGLDGGYRSRALGLRRRGGIEYPIGGVGGAAHCVMEQLVAAGMTTDIQYLNGYFVRRGVQSGIAMPQNQMIIRMLEARMMVNRDYSNKFVPLVGNTYLNSGDSPAGRRPHKQQQKQQQQQQQTAAAPDHQWRSAQGLFDQQGTKGASKNKSRTLSEPTIIDPETSDYGEFDLLDALPAPPSPMYDDVRSRWTAVAKSKPKPKPRAPRWDSMSPLAGDQTLRRYYQDKNQDGVDAEDMPPGSKRSKKTIQDSIYSQEQLKELRHLGYVQRGNYVLQRDRPLGKDVASEITLRLKNVDDVQEELLQNLDQLLETNVPDERAGRAPRSSRPYRKIRRDHVALDPDEPALSLYDDENANIARYYGDDSTPIPDSAPGESNEPDESRTDPLMEAINKLKLEKEARHRTHLARMHSLRTNIPSNPDIPKAADGSGTKL